MATKKEKKLHGLDISKYQTKVDFKQLKKDGIDFVIIRAGGDHGTPYKDSKFEDHYKGAKEAGLYVGAYYDTGRAFKTRTEGIKNALHFINLIKGKKFEMPIYADVETVATCYRSGATDATIAFCDTLEDANYFVGIYASDVSGFKERLDLKRLTQYSLWVARYGKKPEYVKKYDMHQYTSKGITCGIQTMVDMDDCYVDFPSIIKKKHLNGM